ncbi:MAG: Ku protein, partial [Gemmatimonadales bacterium]
MPARSIGSATISFGLVSVPVSLFSSSESSATVSFNMLHTKCGSRLKQQYICSKEGTVVEKDEISKGYEFSKGQYVLFTTEEVKALDEKAANAIDIAEFVPLAAVDRIYLEKVYYLGPDKGGERAYRLLVAALEATGRAALGQYSSRGKQYLVLCRPMGDLLVMEQLHYHAEIRSATDVPRPEVAVKDAELALARQLIEQS